MSKITITIDDDNIQTEFKIDFDYASKSLRKNKTYIGNGSFIYKKEKTKNIIDERPKKRIRIK